MMDRLGVARPDKQVLDSVATKLGFAGESELVNAVAIGDCQVSDIVGVLHGATNVQQLSLLPQPALAAADQFSLLIEARDRDGLLCDITTLLSASGASIVGSSSRLDGAGGAAVITVELRLDGLQNLALVIEQLVHVPDVIDVRRQPN